VNAFFLGKTRQHAGKTRFSAEKRDSTPEKRDDSPEKRDSTQEKHVFRRTSATAHRMNAFSLGKT